MLTELNALAQSLAQTWLAFSVVLAVQIGLILLLRKPVRARLGAVACYRLWLLPLLCLPFYLAGPALMQKLASLNAFVAQPEIQTVSNLQLLIDFELLPFNINAEFAGLSAGGDLVVNGWLVLLLVWSMGTLALLAWQGRRWLDFSRQVAALAVPLPAPERRHCGAAAHFSPDVPVVSLRGMGGAALFGVFKPVLLLSDSFCQRYDNNQRHIILAHEAVHLRRGDNAWNLGAMLLMALFWTNPLVLLAWRYYRLDQELACDALALTRCNTEQQKRYARTLLDSLRSLSPHTAQPGLTAWDNLGDIKERSLMVKHHLRTATRPVVVLFSLLALTVLGASLTVTFAELVSPLAQAAEPARPVSVAQEARQVTRQGQQVEQQERQATQQAQQVEQQERQATQQAQQVEQQERQVTQQAQQVERQARQASQLAQQVEQLERQVTEQAQEVEQLERQVQQLEQETRQVDQQSERTEQEAPQVLQKAEQTTQAAVAQTAQSAPLQVAQAPASQETRQSTRRRGQLTREREDTAESGIGIIDAQTGGILSKAIEFLNMDQFAEAAEVLGKLRVERLSPFERSRFHQLMFNVRMNEEDYPAARAQLQLALDSGGLNAQEDSQMRYQMAQLYLQEEKYAEATAALEAWIAAEESPNSAAYYLLAASYYYQEMFDAALPNAQMSVDLAGDAPMEGWLSMLASLLIQKEDYVAATPVVQRMVDMFPNKETYWVQLSGIHVEQKQYASAETVMAEAVERFPDKAAYRTQLENLKALNAQ